MSVYINEIAISLPNEPVGNEEIENVLGLVAGVPSRIKRIILRNNGITQRYYAIDKETGKITHSNAQLTLEAIEKLNAFKNQPDIDLLCSGTTSADLINPGHALQLQGSLKLPGIETMSANGICMSGMTALKYAYLNILSGDATKAVVTGSEVASSYIRSSFYTPENSQSELLEKKPQLSFNADFLRWMLSDGAGAAYVSNKPNAAGLSLKIHWIDMLSYAGEFDLCMYMGGIVDEAGSVKGWREFDSLKEAVEANCFAIKQNVDLLNEHIIPVSTVKSLKTIADKRVLNPKSVDWFLPHYSSQYFRQRLYQGMVEAGMEIPFDKWFTNLPQKGNTGSASIFIILEELLNSGKLRSGQKILCFVPESGRFSAAYMLLEVV